MPGPALRTSASIRSFNPRLRHKEPDLLVPSHRLVSGDARMESQDSGANALTLYQLHTVHAQPLTYPTVPPQGTRDVVKARDSKVEVAMRRNKEAQETRFPGTGASHQVVSGSQDKPCYPLCLQLLSRDACFKEISAGSPWSVSRPTKTALRCLSHPRVPLPQPL